MLQSDKTKKFEELDQVEQNAIKDKLNRINQITQKPKLKYLAARYLDQAPDAEIKSQFEEIPEAFINGLNTNRNNITYKLGNQQQVLPTDYLEFSQIIHALAAAKAKPVVVEEEELNLDSLENPIEIFDINSAADSMKFYSILPWQGQQWCITWPNRGGKSNQWWPYRQRYESTFYIVVDNTLPKSNPFHAVAVDHTKTGLKITDLRNGSEESYFTREYPELAGADNKPRSYNNYLLDVHKIDSARFPFKPLNQEEIDAYNFFSKKRVTLDEFKELFLKEVNEKYENAPLKYIQLPTELTDEQFKYLIDIKREDLVRAYLNGVFLINDYKFSLLNNNYKTTYERKEDKLIEEAKEIGKLHEICDSAKRVSTLKKIISVKPDYNMSDKLLDSIKSNNLEMTKYIINNISTWDSGAFAAAKDIDMIEYLWHYALPAGGSNGIRNIGIAIKNFSKDLIANNYSKDIFERLINLETGIFKAKVFIRMGGRDTVLIRHLYTKYNLGEINFFESSAAAMEFIDVCALHDPVTLKFILENQLDRNYHDEFKVSEESYKIVKDDYEKHKINNDGLQENHFFDKIDIKGTLSKAIEIDNVPFVEQLVKDQKSFLKTSKLDVTPQSIPMASIFEKVKKERGLTDLTINMSTIVKNAVRDWTTSSLKWLSENFDKPELRPVRLGMPIVYNLISDNPVEKLQLLIDTYKFPLDTIHFAEIIISAYYENDIKLMQFCSKYSRGFDSIFYSRSPSCYTKLETLKFVHENLFVDLEIMNLKHYIEDAPFRSPELVNEKKKIVNYLIQQGFFNEQNLNEFAIGTYDLESYKELQFPIQNLNVKKTIENLEKYDIEFLEQALSLIKNYNGVDGIQFFNAFVAEKFDDIDEDEDFYEREKEEEKNRLKIKLKDGIKIQSLLLNGFNEYTIDFNFYFRTLYKRALNLDVENTEGIEEMFKAFKENNWYRNVSIKIPTDRMSNETFLKLVTNYEVPVEFIDIFEPDGLMESNFFGDKYEFLSSIREYILQAIKDTGYSPKYSVGLLGSKALIEIFEKNLEFLVDFNTCFNPKNRDFLSDKLGFIHYLSIKDPDTLVDMLSRCLNLFNTSLTIPLKINVYIPENIKNKLAEKNKIYKDFTENNFSNFTFEISPDNYNLYKDLILKNMMSVDAVLRHCPVQSLTPSNFFIAKDLLKLGADPKEISKLIIENYSEYYIRANGGDVFYTFLRDNFY